MPLVVYVHGGSWTSGDKSEIIYYRPQKMALAYLTANGYVVAAVNYRLAPTYPFPAMIEDVKCAVRYFRANAPLYQIDPTRVAVWGASAGGHLAALAGDADASAGWDVGTNRNASSRVEAVVDWYGATDLNRLWTQAEAFGAPEPTAYAAGSPVTYVTADDPPTLIQHGAEDKTISPDQSSEYRAALATATVPNQLVLIQNADHGFAPVGPNPIRPSLDQIAQQLVAFLNVALKDNPNPKPQ